MKKKSIYKLLQYKKYQIIRIASNKKIKFPSDIDLQEFIYTNDTYLAVYEFFRDIFDEAYMNPDIYIIDFKCGFMKGKLIKWSYKDIKNGYVTKFDINIPFGYALSNSSIIKIDVIALINNIFIEFSYITTFISNDIIIQPKRRQHHHKLKTCYYMTIPN